MGIGRPDLRPFVCHLLSAEHENAYTARDLRPDPRRGGSLARRVPVTSGRNFSDGRLYDCPGEVAAAVYFKDLAYHVEKSTGKNITHGCVI